MNPYDPLAMQSLPEWRYQHDAKFHAYVDMMHHLIQAAEITPTEVREAAMLACIHYEHYTCRQIYLNRDQYNFSEMKEPNFRQDVIGRVKELFK